MRVGIALFFMNYTDWERHEALKRGEPVGPMAIDDEQVWREHVALADLVEPLGFDSLWTFEHHGSPYLLLPAPQQQLAFYAGRTRRIDLGTMVTVLPWHNPVRLAENIAVLQHQLGRGRRFVLGIGRGLARREFQAMGIDMEESRGRFNEVLEILRLAFTQEVFSYDGEFFQVSNVSIRPRPLDPSTVVDAYAVWTSEASKQNAARLGLHPLTTPTQRLEDFKRDLEDFDAIRAENGFGPANPPILQMPLYCCDSDQEADEGAERYFSEYTDAVIRNYELGGEHFKTTKGYDSYAPGAGASGGHAPMSGDRAETHAKLTALFHNNAICGSPDTCLEKLVAVHELMAPAEVVLVADPASMPAAESERSMRLVAEQVLPRLAGLRAVAVQG
jgi:alkanesulfonate monooxygenase SsuD/methylene tetrahydromethanopterin reductase-like flavin-dependent oxidoreductase (luciferase family)